MPVSNPRISNATRFMLPQGNGAGTIEEDRYEFLNIGDNWGAPVL
jgi:hypothetical protein